MPTILVTGSTGSIGSRTVASLQSKPGVQVRATVHERSPGGQHRGAQVVQVDYNRPETLSAAAAGVDAVFLITAAAPDQVQVAKRAIDALAAANTRHVLRLSAIGAERADAPIFIRQHTEME